MCQFMAQHLPNLLVAPESVVPIGTDAELDKLSLVNIQTQQVWVLVWGEFRQQSDREFVRIHRMEDRVIVCQFREQGPSRFRVREVC